jgi:hypothetical protein
MHKSQQLLDNLIATCLTNVSQLEDMGKVNSEKNRGLEKVNPRI